MEYYSALIYGKETLYINTKQEDPKYIHFDMFFNITINLPVVSLYLRARLVSRLHRGHLPLIAWRHVINVMIYLATRIQTPLSA